MHRVWLCICGVLTYGWWMPLYAKLNCALHSQFARIAWIAWIWIHARTTRYAHLSVGLAGKRGRATTTTTKNNDKLGNKVDWLAEQKSFIWRSFRLPPLPPPTLLPPPSITHAKLVRWLDSSLFAILHSIKWKSFFFLPPTSHAHIRRMNPGVQQSASRMHRCIWVYNFVFHIFLRLPTMGIMLIECIHVGCRSTVCMTACSIFISCSAQIVF